ncbi:expressed unknown protein [Seminavis robusta]|uniref:Uncharacterized protein n=1 Tax=Seminavis robusta TaxID=568900 RepID=A0A9N8H3Y8_9STRA|nr:expressed unknown protein [Seminavis robusta]|eukprot:Sro37_g023170.1 n/a (724) ;mRNA; f:46652-49130
MNHDEVQQSQVVDEFHNFPRFGHGNSIASLASHDRSNQEDYIQGMLSFCFFLLLIVYVWGFVLIVLKFATPRKWVGCAGGGKTLDVAKMRKAKIPRHIRRKQILRAWRIQLAFLSLSMLIPIMTLLMTRNGLAPFINSLDEISSINDEVEAVAFHGISIAEELQAARRNLANVTTQQQQQGYMDLDWESSCPNFHNSSTMLALAPISTIQKYIDSGLEEVKAFIDYYAMDAHIALTRVVRMSDRVKLSIEWIYDSDWLLKFFLLTINVVNGFFLFGVFLSKQDVVNYKMQRFLSLWIIPIFVVLLMCCAVLACAFGMAVMFNADFCHGNTSVNGSMHEIIVESGVRESDLTNLAFRHYFEGCLGENPMGFIHDVDSVIKYAKDAANLLRGEPIIIIHEHCSDDASALVSQFSNITSILDDVQRQVRAVIELTGCHQINPVLRRIIHGATCSDTIDSLAWLFGGLCFIFIIGLMMLSVRAALFNSVIRAPRRKRQREREKEWEEYKQYMDHYYDGVGEWAIDGPPQPPPQQRQRHPDFTLAQIPTFDTEETSKTSLEVGGDGDSDIACFASPMAQSYASTSSYESDYSEDSDEDQQSSMSFSMLSKFFHSRLGNDQSSSFFDADSQFAAKTQLSVLELQTPRQRRKQTALGSYLYQRSPVSDYGTPMRHTGITSPTQRSTPRAPPPAPSKSRLTVHRTDGTTPSAPSKPRQTENRTAKGSPKDE